MAEVKGKSIRIAGKHICTVNVPSMIRMILLTALALFMILPLVYIISTSLKPLDELYLFPPKFITTRPTFSNFKDLFSALDGASVPFARYFFNSFMVSVLTVLGTVLVCCMGAYGLVKHRPKGAGHIFSLILAALMFSGQVTLIPMFLMINAIGWTNTYQALILPMVGAFGIFLMRQFMDAVPDELLEAAEIDGCGELHRFFTIVLPLVQPALITLTIFTFNGAWNNFLWPLIINTRSSMHVLTITMATLTSNQTTNYGMVMAGATLTFLFPFVLYIFLQKQFVEGIALGGVKG